ncbi:MAG: acyltransferase family protein [Nitriliruptoraceae bacterium]
MTARQERVIARAIGLRAVAAKVEERTPVERDRFADLVRVVALLLVVLGHWLVAVIVVDDDRFVATQLLVVEPWTRWATWVWQVMPLFFLVGGRVNAGSLRRHRARGDAWSAWVRRRSRRLLRPMLPLLLVWMVLGPVLEAAGMRLVIVERAAEVAFMPLWFLVVYTLVIVLAPASWWLHRRAGWWLPAVATVLVAVVDALHGTGVPVVGQSNHLLVFAVAHQVGYLWADDRLPFGRRGLWLAGGGAIWLVLLVLVLDYPVSMVGVEGPTRSNAAPASLALVALTVTQTGILLVLRRPCERWLHRSEVAWAAVATTGASIITIFLWHMSALVVVASLTHLTGWWPDVAPVGPAWWALRPVWVLLCTVALVALVLLFRDVERVGPAPPGGWLRTSGGVLAAAGGLYLILVEGWYDADRALRLPVPALVLLFAGLWLLGVLGRTPREGTSP